MKKQKKKIQIKLLRALVTDLKKQVEILIEEPNGERATVIRTCYKMQQQFEKAIWTGSVNAK